MKDWLIVFGFSYVLGYASRHVVGWWNTNKTKIPMFVDQLETRIETRLGVELPSAVHDRLMGLVDDAVHFVDGYASDPAFVRNVLRILAGKNPAGLERFKIWAGSIDWKQKIADQIPDDLKPFWNEAKADVAVKIAHANAQKVLPAEHVPEPLEIRGMVNVVATGAKVGEIPQPVTRDQLERLIKESEARQEALRK